MALCDPRVGNVGHVAPVNKRDCLGENHTVAASLSLPAHVNIDFELDGFASLGNALARFKRRDG